MVTISYSDLLLTVITVCFTVVSVAAIMTIVRIRSSLQRFDGVIDAAGRLTPALDRLLQESEATVRSARLLSDQVSEIAEDVESVTDETQRAAAPIIRELGHHADNALVPLRQLSALIVGTKAGLAALGRDR